MTPIDIRKLLSRLCVDVGFCLPPAEVDRLASNPPDGVDKFVEAVFLAEGLDQSVARKSVVRQVRSRVRDAYLDSAQLLYYDIDGLDC